VGQRLETCTIAFAAGVINLMPVVSVLKGILSTHLSAKWPPRNVYDYAMCRSAPVHSFSVDVVGFSASGSVNVIVGVEAMHVERSG
jgi:hypothetical protein